MPALDLLVGFEAAARHLSFTKAGEELNLTQSAVSRQIKELEDQLGAALFQRRHRALSLTESGQQFYAAAAQVLTTMRGGHRAAARAGGAAAAALRHHHPLVRRAVADPAARRLHARPSGRRRAHHRRDQGAGPGARRPRRGAAPRAERARRAGRGAPVRREGVPGVQPGAAEEEAAGEAGRPAPAYLAAIRRSRRAPSVAALAHLARGRAHRRPAARPARYRSRATSRSSPPRSPGTASRSGAARW